MESYIKIYTKILENPKVGRLDDKTWRIMMELFLLAGETFDDGNLPDADSIAWKLRRPEKDIVSALQKLAEIGTVTLSGDNATVTNFVKYQNTNQTSYERVKRYRNRHSDNATDTETSNNAVTDDNTNETQMKRNCVTNDNADDNAVTPLDKDIDIDIDIDKELINTCADAQIPVAKSQKSTPENDANFWKFAKENVELAKTFYEATGIYPVKSQFGKWVKDLRDLADAEITAEQLRKTISYMRTEGISIYTPGSCLKTAQYLKSRGSVPVKTQGKQKPAYNAFEELAMQMNGITAPSWDVEL